MGATANFHNEGFGWVCRKCEDQDPGPVNTSKRSRLMSEGESEGKVPRLSNAALARWTDDKRDTLHCPRCGMTEKVL